MNEKFRKVLVLDDDQAIRMSFADFFEDRGWMVLSAETAEDALEILKGEKPDGSIVDVRLPGKGGNLFILEACKLRPTLAYVVCTGSPEYRLPTELRDLQQVCGEIFFKPVSSLSLLEDALICQIEKVDYFK